LGAPAVVTDSGTTKTGPRIALGSLWRGESFKVINSVIRGNFVGIEGRDPVKLRKARLVGNGSGNEGRSDTRTTGRLS
jgi:hypothetical protein